LSEDILVTTTEHAKYMTACGLQLQSIVQQALAVGVIHGASKVYWDSSRISDKLYTTKVETCSGGLESFFPKTMLSGILNGDSSLSNLLQQSFSGTFQELDWDTVKALKGITMKAASLDLLKTVLSIVSAMRKALKAPTRVSTNSLLLHEILLWLCEDDNAVVDYHVCDDGNNIRYLGKLVDGKEKDRISKCSVMFF
jgi:hypothetical protein